MRFHGFRCPCLLATVIVITQFSADRGGDAELLPWVIGGYRTGQAKDDTLRLMRVKHEVGKHIYLTT